MSMTAEEKAAHDYITEYLIDEGYAPYAKIFDKLDLHLTNASNVVGFMEPQTGSITINRNIEDGQFSVIIRHEILHGFLQHELRLLRHLADKQGLDYDSIVKETDVKELSQLNRNRVDQLKKELYQDKSFNIAGDYDISNNGYTEEDKDVIREIQLNGKKLRGLITSDDHPEWVGMSLEDMYDEIIAQKQKDKQQLDNQKVDDQDNSNQSQKPRKRIHGKLIDSKTFIDLDGNIITHDN